MRGSKFPKFWDEGAKVNFGQIKSFLYHWRAFKESILEMNLHPPFGNKSYNQKKGQKSNGRRVKALWK